MISWKKRMAGCAVKVVAYLPAVLYGWKRRGCERQSVWVSLVGKLGYGALYDSNSQ